VYNIYSNTVATFSSYELQQLCFSALTYRRRGNRSSRSYWDTLWQLSG